MSTTPAFDEARSAEQASSIAQNVGSVVVVVTIALGLLLGPGAVAS